MVFNVGRRRKQEPDGERMTHTNRVLLLSSKWWSNDSDWPLLPNIWYPPRDWRADASTLPMLFTNGHSNYQLPGERNVPAYKYTVHEPAIPLITTLIN